MTETALDRARAGDEPAFRELTEPHRSELRLHCYRILGSLDDAEDLVQETMAAAWKGIAGFEGRASMRTWLYRIATNRCLNAKRDAARRAPVASPAPYRVPEANGRNEVTWLQPYPDTLLQRIADGAPGPEARYVGREAVELAFITGLQMLPPRQAAALVLRDVLGFPSAEVADMIGTGETALKGVLQRARASLDKHRAGEAPPPPGSDIDRDLSRRFAAAFCAGDIDGVVELLTDDAWLSMPPTPETYRGLEAIVEFLHAGAAWRGGHVVRLVPTRANGQPAFGYYLAENNRTPAHSAGLVVLTLSGDRIRAVERFLSPGPLHHYRLEETLDAAH
ncbi:RNA polymerase subunit sigma-70 [Glycomyces buryatensis]|uniref:RNA polymerase sigma factor n=1 Tax=Glycomyces buryatensis TaxID=2570927 RepID=A0A4V6T6S1_9ACTN|nr:RNA polymerase subunit sigma-70 [Glycomyces buryatensis]THV43006.1 sigma-70 family RNA polymerase sigma factor [Glycomyces buryatensis]